ncbi:N-acetylglucosamine-6-phosphate deacetylase-like isoform X2 [Penaeus japonicus]|nr:N-acetylglucosamine-6-phosphate deacetylase-like isoform X2 [Penaeus japonicus]XP_042891346.1 N-acetylglucosamine-6-phosphate deacetylase-like isoform X2 [Penaeus japonicus]XP_042891347.1 N-acetylglucosamine-6-phosphate deacetylase-like isoform X2 [Penaeus japonicus]XP_042891348.1 N-acetylglucosamine-6-phosphate deacetylase-like isoform X2 [Penaeus japonicus]
MPSVSSSSAASSSRNLIYQFINCRLIRGGRIIKDDFWVRNGKILNPEPVFYEEKLQADVRVDCHDALICPGFIDVQVNGGFGYDFSSDADRLEEAVSSVARGVLATGVTSFCPTLVTSPDSVYHKIMPRVDRTEGGKDGAGILGVHLEGPFISPEKKGAHPLNYIQNLDQGFSKLEATYGRLDNTAVVTIAPELAGAKEVIAELSNRGIVVSVGHSNGNLEDGEAAVNSGASFITHLFNAMLPFHHRDPGLVGLLTSRKISRPVFYGIIADGIHTHPAALRIAHRTHAKGLVLVSDGMAAMGLGEGEHHIGQMMVKVQGRRAVLAGTDTLAGSVATMDDCVRVFISDAGVSVVEGIEAATLHPAQLMGIAHQKGSLDYDSDADFLFVSDKGPLKVLNTFIAGECVYSSPEAPQLIYKESSTCKKQ